MLSFDDFFSLPFREEIAHCVQQLEYYMCQWEGYHGSMQIQHINVTMLAPVKSRSLFWQRTKMHKALQPIFFVFPKREIERYCLLVYFRQLDIFLDNSFEGTSRGQDRVVQNKER